MRTTKDYGKRLLAANENVDPPPEGFDVWIENGVWYIAPEVDPKRFGGHAYANGGYERGVRDCPCGCHMLSSSSGGPCDPFGACPENPLPIDPAI